MTLPQEVPLLRIFIGEADRIGSVPLYKWIVRKARENGMAGATVLRGIMGYGANSRVHTTKILRLSVDLPIVVEIVDTEDKIQSFIPTLNRAITEGLITLERVQVLMYRSSLKGTSGTTGEQTSNSRHFCLYSLPSKKRRGLSTVIKSMVLLEMPRAFSLGKSFLEMNK